MPPPHKVERNREGSGKLLRWPSKYEYHPYLFNMRPAFLAVALSFVAAATAATLPPRPFNVSMLRSQLPADSPLLAAKPKPLQGAYNPVTAKLFVYFSGAAYCDQAAIMDWCVWHLPVLL